MRSDYRRKQAYPLTKINNVKFGELVYTKYHKSTLFTKKGIRKKMGVKKIYREYVNPKKIYAHPELADKLISLNIIKG